MVVLKVGGHELDDETFLFGLAKAVQAVIGEGHFPVIVHGGGKAVTELGAKLGITERRIEGLRVTDEASLDVAEMVLSGLMNKRIVRLLVNAGIRAAGISGVDDGTIYVEKMWHPLGDLGRVGEVQDVDDHLLDTLIAAGSCRWSARSALGPRTHLAITSTPIMPLPPSRPSWGRSN